jgi:hypothetical protein
MLAITSPVDTSTWFEGEYACIPERMRAALIRYVVDHAEVGQFLTAVICNDLRKSVGYADDENLPLLPVYVRWFYNVAPAGCFGSAPVMAAWLEQGKQA